MEVRSAPDWVTTPRPYWTCFTYWPYGSGCIGDSFRAVEELNKGLHAHIFLLPYTRLPKAHNPKLRSQTAPNSALLEWVSRYNQGPPHKSLGPACFADILPEPHVTLISGRYTL
jgi:hypothetical protein